MLNGSYGVLANTTEDNIIESDQYLGGMWLFNISDYTLSKLSGDLVSSQIIRMAKADPDENALEYVFRIYIYFHKVGYMNIYKRKNGKKGRMPVLSMCPDKIIP